MVVIMRIPNRNGPAHGTRSSLFAPHIIRDGLDYVASPITRQPFTSKRAYERHIKENGCSIAGNDSSIVNPKAKEITAPDGVAESIKQALSERS
jgi:hypothetical protein